MTFTGKSEHQRRLTRKCRNSRSLRCTSLTVNGREVLGVLGAFLGAGSGGQAAGGFLASLAGGKLFRPAALFGSTRNAEDRGVEVVKCRS